jgi:hypothetical protein
MFAIVERLPPVNIAPASRRQFFIKVHHKPMAAGTGFLKEWNVS